MFKPGEEVCLRRDLKLARQQRGETAAETRARRVTIAEAHPDWTYTIRLSDEETLVVPETDLARVPPNLPVFKDDGKPETELDKTVRLMGLGKRDRLSWGLRMKLKDALKTLEVRSTDWKGHYKRGAVWADESRFYTPVSEILGRYVEMLLMCMEVHDEQASTLIAAVEANEALLEPVSLGTYYEMKCHYCGKELEVGCDGVNFTILGHPCEEPDGFDVTEWDLNVPSGKLVVANDLRDWFPTDQDFDINGTRGTHLCQLSYADVGMSHGFVGNSCPGIYKLGDGKLIVSNPPPEEVWNEETETHDPSEAHAAWLTEHGAEQVASVCTDLWWYSIVDLDEFRRRVAHYTPDQDADKLLTDSYIDVVDVEPGVYRFQHFNEINRDANWKHGTEVRFCVFERVRGPDPLMDYIGIDADKEITAERALPQSCTDWPTLYLPKIRGEYDDRKPLVACVGRERARALAAAACQIMCTNGNGVDWHPNGFPRMVVAPGTRSMRIPPFNFRHGWYPISPGFSHDQLRADAAPEQPGLPTPLRDQRRAGTHGNRRPLLLEPAGEVPRCGVRRGVRRVDGHRAVEAGSRLHGNPGGHRRLQVRRDYGCPPLGRHRLPRGRWFVRRAGEAL
jgi:hypothetical protein